MRRKYKKNKQDVFYSVDIMTLTSKQLRDLDLIHKCPKPLRKQLYKKINARTIKAISECCLNLLAGNIDLTAYQKKELKKHKHTLRHIAKKRNSLFSKKKLIIQKGGFLNFLIPAAISTISALIHGV